MGVSQPFILCVKPRANGRNIVGCYMLRPLPHPVACCWMLLHKVWNRSNFSANHSQHVPWSPKRSATMLDPFAQLFQHCWGHARSLRMVYKDLWVSFPRRTAGPNIVGSCCIRLHTTANTHVITPNILAQQCWELLRPFASSLTMEHSIIWKLRFLSTKVYADVYGKFLFAKFFSDVV